MAQNNDEIAAEIVRMFEQEKARRGVWESHCQEIADRVWPDNREGFVSNYITEGKKNQSQVFDSTAATALNRFAAIMDSLLTPRNQTWHRIKASDEFLNKDRAVKLWFDDVNRMLFKFRYHIRANFAAQNQLNFKSLGAFGSAAMYIDRLYSEPGLRYKNCHMGEIFFFENHQGAIDQIIRHFKLTSRQAIQKWGAENLPSQIITQHERDPNSEFFFLHFVGPREDADPDRADFKGMPYKSIYVSITEKQLLEEGGYNTFPYAPSRYEQAMNEVYGRSPAMEVLPAIKTLNEQKKTLLKQGHRTVDPVLLVHDDGILDAFSLEPGSANPGGVSKDGKPLVHTLPVGRVDIGRELMIDERTTINDAFLLTIFQILIETPTMTATEVMERAREKGVLLAPTIGRQESERLGPQIEREVDILSQQGLLPPMPPILQEAGANFEVEYDSPLSRAQRAEEAAGLLRTVESALNVVNVTQDPAPLDHFNWDVIIPELAEINAVPAKWLRSGEDVLSIRDGRAQAQQQQQLIDAGPAIASLSKGR